MDVPRGSRRARHAASAASSQEASLQAQAQLELEAATQHRRTRRQALQVQVTPDASIAVAAGVHVHQAPEFGHRRREMEPPPNPFRLHRSTRRNTNNRLSLQFDSDGSGSGSGTESEPDLSHLGMTRRGMTAVLEQQADQMTYDDDAMSQGQYDAEEASLDENLDENVDDNDDDNVDEQVEGEQEPLAMMDPVVFGLKEISNLGKFTVSSHKPGNGVEQLRSDDLTSYWQSDGPQPHKLTIYFVKRVGIRDIRFYVNYNEDESYTPTKIIFKSGTSENNLIQFAAMNLASPVGWQQVPLAGVGGEPDGNTLVSWVLQMQILENHQNGKDTHLRGIKIYAFDADAVQPSEAENSRMDEPLDTMDVAESLAAASTPRLDEIAQTLAAARLEGGDSGFTLPDFMRDAEIR
ncbi:DOC domain-containing protein [Trichoderma simmonsii]|uniref:DOC domain-containing protein n=1 Tax=Trichoderma simmonsii TaxID=1491479 RepID=A0A8G0L9R0_9HYPO|nr:DOC domain-containing protein [Trichoderma simmonsii]